VKNDDRAHIVSEKLRWSYRLKAAIRAAASTRVNFLLLEYSLLYISGCKSNFRLQFFQSFDELLEFMET